MWRGWGRKGCAEVYVGDSHANGTLRPIRYARAIGEPTPVPHIHLGALRNLDEDLYICDVEWRVIFSVAKSRRYSLRLFREHKVH